MAAVAKAAAELARKLPMWDARGWVPTEPYPEVSSDPRPLRFGMPTWSDMFSPRQLLALCSYVEALHDLVPEIERDLPKDRAKAVVTYLGMVLSKAVNYNSYLASWHTGRAVMRGVFDRHDYSFKWTYGEFDASRNLFPWGLDQVCDAYDGIAKLAEPAHRVLQSGPGRARARPGHPDLPQRICPTSRTAAMDLVLTDPPYYDNVMYGELSDFFYVWLKRTVGSVASRSLRRRFGKQGRRGGREPRAIRASWAARRSSSPSGDYERKMAAAFRETHRVLSR